MSSPIGERGRIVEVVSDSRALAALGGRLVLVSAYRSGPMTRGDGVRVVAEDETGPVVDVSGGRAEIVRHLASTPRRTKVRESARITTR